MLLNEIENNIYSYDKQELLGMKSMCLNAMKIFKDAGLLEIKERNNTIYEISLDHHLNDPWILEEDKKKIKGKTLLIGTQSCAKRNFIRMNLLYAKAIKTIDSHLKRMEVQNER